ncbi:granzyme B(G,H) [Gadus morhua]|uniref:trypsin n=1 Tax=Gadus morhua TaxID=8049 RepID=A0A8C5AV35_GADMO|nr:granzyme B(G,H)-like [Gadus morhua]
MALHNTLVVLMLVLSLRGQVQTGKIIGGHPAVPHGRPYMVLLERRMWNDETKFCGGFLISDQFVVTAAHCQARIYNVYVGLHKFKNDQTTKAIQVCQAIPHEDFNEKTILNDLMLLQLSEKVNFTDHVRPINLASRGDPLPQRCMVSRWGFSEENPNEMARELREVNVRPINLASRGDHLPQRCIVSGWGFSEENPNEMASELREVNVTLVKHTLPADRHVYTSLGESGPSNGDSGGPLVCEGEVAYGVVSGGTQKFKLYTKIPDYLGWILGHMMKK